MMNMLRNIRRIRRPAAVALPLALPCALLASAALAAPTWPDVPGSAWKVSTTTTSGTVRLSTTVDRGTVHAVCGAGKCDMFVEPASGCIPGAEYPVLVNSKDKVGVMRSRCVLVNEAGQPRLVAHVAQTTELLGAIVSGTDITIAFPTQRGAMDVLSVRMQGAARLLANALRTASQTPNASASNAGAPGSAQAPANTAATTAVQASTTRYQI